VDEMRETVVPYRLADDGLGEQADQNVLSRGMCVDNCIRYSEQYPFIPTLISPAADSI
jgi:hypothetical protein